MKRTPFNFPARRCPVCERPLPPEGVVCPYCDEPLPSSWTSRLSMVCCGSAVILGMITCSITGSLPTLALPATLVHGLLLAGGTAVLLSPFRWQRLMPPTQHERLAVIRHALAQRFCALLTTVLLLFVLRRQPDTWVIAIAITVFLGTITAAARASRDTRAGLLAGLLIGLA